MQMRCKVKIKKLLRSQIPALLLFRVVGTSIAIHKDCTLIKEVMQVQKKQNKAAQK